MSKFKLGDIVKHKGHTSNINNPIMTVHSFYIKYKDLVVNVPDQAEEQYWVLCKYQSSPGTYTVEAFNEFEIEIV